MTSVRVQGAGYLSHATSPTMTGDFTISGWLRCNAGEYGGASEQNPFGLGTTGGTSEGLLLDVGITNNTTCSAVVFRNGAAELQKFDFLTGSDTGWVCWAFRHASGSASYTFSYRREGATSWTSTTLTLTTQIASSSGIWLGNDQFLTEQAKDSNIRHFFVQATNLSDSALLTATQNIGTAPAGTNLHYLALSSVATATANGGTAGAWTKTGTLVDSAAEVSEAPFVPVAQNRVIPEPLPLLRGGAGPVARSLPPFWPPREIPRSTVNAPLFQNLDVPLLTSSAAVLAPTIFVPIGAVGVTYSPTLPGEFNRKVPPFWPPSQIPRSTSGASVNLTVPLLTSSAATVTPSLSVSLSAGLLTSSAATVAPSVSTGIAAPLLTSSAATLAPAVSVSAAVPLLSSAAAVLAPSVSVGLAGALLTSSAAVLAPSVADGLAAPLLSASSSLPAPALTVSLAAPLLTSSAAVLAPSVTTVGQLSPPVLVSSAAPVAPALAVSLSAPALAASPSLPAPSVTKSVSTPLLSATATVLAPRDDVGLAVPLFSASSSLLVPTVATSGGTSLTPPVLASSAAMLSPSLAVSVALPLLSATPFVLPPYSVDGSTPSTSGETGVSLGMGGVSLDGVRLRSRTRRER